MAKEGEMILKLAGKQGQTKHSGKQAHVHKMNTGAFKTKLLGSVHSFKLVIPDRSSQSPLSYERALHWAILY